MRITKPSLSSCAAAHAEQLSRPTLIGQKVLAGQVLLTIESAEISEAYSDFVKAESDLQLAQRSFDLTSDLTKPRRSPDESSNRSGTIS